MNKSIKKNAILKMLLNILNIIIPIITGPYLARTLDVYLFGEYNKALSIVSFLIPFAGFGIYNYGIREISKVRKDETKVSVLFSILFFIGMISSITMFIIYMGYITFFIDSSNKYVNIIMGIELIACIFAVEYMNEAFENYDFILYKTLVIRIVNIFLIFTFVRKSDDIINYAMIISIIQLINQLSSFFYITRKTKIRLIKFHDFSRVFKALIIMFIMMNANMLYTYLDRLFLSVFSHGYYVTHYMFSMQIINILTNVINAIVIVTLPRLASYIGEDNQEEYKKLLKTSSGLFFMLCVPMCFGFFVLSKAIIFIYGGDKYISAYTVFAMYSLRMLCWTADYSMGNQIIFIHGREKVLTKIYFLCGGINLVLNSLLVVFGILSATTAILTTIIAEIVVISIEYYYIRTYINKDYLVNISKKVPKYIFISLGFIVIEYVLRILFHVQYVINLNLLFYIICTIIICVVYYFGCLFITKDDIFAESLNEVKKMSIVKKICRIS